MPCKMDDEIKIKLIKEYQDGDKEKKVFLEKAYGKVQIKEIVQNQLTKDYLKVQINTFSFNLIYT